MTYNNHFTTKCLGAEDIPAFLALHEAVPPEKKGFLKPRTPEDLQAHIDSGMPMMGVYDGNKLVAGALLTFSGRGPVKFLEGYTSLETAAVVQSVAAIQKGAMGTLMGFAKEQAHEAGYHFLMAKVNSENKCGVGAFSKHQFDIVETKPDPLGGNYTAHFMRAVVASPVPAVATEPQHGQGLPGCQFLTEALLGECQPAHT